MVYEDFDQNSTEARQAPETLRTIYSFLEDDMRFLTTCKGYIGWAHPRAEKGDKIYLLQGCSVPAILRKKPDGGYVIVGDAYVQGIMNGEAIKDFRDSDWTSIQIY